MSRRDQTVAAVPAGFTNSTVEPAAAKHRLALHHTEDVGRVRSLVQEADVLGLEPALRRPVGDVVALRGPDDRRLRGPAADEFHALTDLQRTFQSVGGRAEVDGRIGGRLLQRVFK